MASRSRQERQRALCRIVRMKRPHTQQELAEHLKQEGFEATQATVSRDIAELKMVKARETGCYELPEDLRMRRMVSELVVSATASNNLVLIKTSPGSAQGVGAAIDGAGLDGALGSVAGDDTILIVAKDEPAAEALASVVTRLVEG